MFQSTIFQLCWGGFSWVEPVLSKDKCVLFRDTTQRRRWGSNPLPLGLESSTLPLSLCAPWWSDKCLCCWLPGQYSNPHFNATPKKSIFWLVSLGGQTDLSLTWYQTLKTGFLASSPYSKTLNLLFWCICQDMFVIRVHRLQDVCVSPIFNAYMVHIGFNLLLPGKFFRAFCHLLIFSKIVFFFKFLEYSQSVKQFGSRSGPMFCQAWSGSKLFAKFISRRH